MKRKVWNIALIIILLAAFFYVVMPVIHYDSYFIVFLAFMLLILLIFSFIVNKADKRLLAMAVDPSVQRIISRLFGNKTSYYIISGATIFVAAFILINIFLQIGFISFNERRELLGENLENTSFSSGFNDITTENVRLMPKTVSKRLASKKIGQNQQLASQVRLGDGTVQEINGTLFWVYPLEYDGLLKWITRSYIPGYIKVRADTTDANAKFVRKNNNGEDLKINVLNSSYFNENLKRTVYFNGNITSLIKYNSCKFEISPEGNPKRICSRFSRDIGFQGENVKGVIVVDAQNGEVEEYNSLNKIPDWIERVQDENIIIKQVNNHGLYHNGYGASWTNKGTYKLNKNEMYIVHGEDGNSYWFGDITTRNVRRGDKGNKTLLGFMLIDTVTKETRYVKLGEAGAASDEAERASEGAIQEKNYIAAQGIIYNINGYPSYVIPLMDKEGLIKRISVVNASNYNVYGIGESFNEALNDYMTNVSTKLNQKQDPSKEGEEDKQDDNVKVVTGSIARINKDSKGNYFVKLKDSEKIFTVGEETNTSDIVLSDEGDNIKIKVFKNNLENDIISVFKYENLDLKE